MEEIDKRLVAIFLTITDTPDQTAKCHIITVLGLSSNSETESPSEDRGLTFRWTKSILKANLINISIQNPLFLTWLWKKEKT